MTSGISEFSYAPFKDVAYVKLRSPEVHDGSIATHGWPVDLVGILIADFASDGVVRNVEIHSASVRLSTECLSAARLETDVDLTAKERVARSQRVARLVPEQ